jgi:hypothetical protein
MLHRAEPRAWLTDVLERTVSGRTEAHKLEQLLPWARQAERLAARPPSIPKHRDG